MKISRKRPGLLKQRWKVCNSHDKTNRHLWQKEAYLLYVEYLFRCSDNADARIFAKGEVINMLAEYDYDTDIAVQRSLVIDVGDQPIITH